MVFYAILSLSMVPTLSGGFCRKMPVKLKTRCFSPGGGGTLVFFTLLILVLICRAAWAGSGAVQIAGDSRPAI